ncbi:MAG: Slam-dependent surface lipoprotein [Neisseria animaloris]|nr:Slam-dependent surface lipoprotein [Neisseria animaloris]
MKINMQKATVAILAALLGSSVYANTNYSYGEADGYWVPNDYVKPHKKHNKKWGKPASEAEGEKVMKNAARRSGVHYKDLKYYSAHADRNGVKTIHAKDRYSGEHLGRYAFQTIKSGGSEVYFGEWVGKEYAKGTNRGVYYVGDKRATHMPAAGVANYAVKGINNYSGNNMMTGTLRADFGQKTLVGSMKNSAVHMDIHAHIKPHKASFKGHARANGHYGKTEGHFFGHGASALAGVAKFKTNRNLDTAYGGVKK